MPTSAHGFVLRGFDCALQRAATEAAAARWSSRLPRATSASPSICPRLQPGLRARPVDDLPAVRRFGGRALRVGRGRRRRRHAAALRRPRRWLPLVEQRRPRFAIAGRAVTPVLDGARAAIASWHRLMLDGCLPAGHRVTVARRDARRRATQHDARAHAVPARAAAACCAPTARELPWLLRRTGRGHRSPRGHRLAGSCCSSERAAATCSCGSRCRGDELAHAAAGARCAPGRRASPTRARYLPAVYREDERSRRFPRALSRQLRGHVHRPRRPHRRRVGAVRRAHAPRPTTLDWLARLARPGARPGDGRVAPPPAHPRSRYRSSVPRHDARSAPGGRSWPCRVRRTGRSSNCPKPSQRSRTACASSSVT